MPDLYYKNRRIIIGLGGALLLIILFLIFRDSSRTITAEQLDVLMQKKIITRVIREDPYLYVRTAHMLYKVPVEVVDLKRLGQAYPIEIRRKWNPLNIGVILLLLIFAATIVIIYYLLRRDRMQSSTKVGLTQARELATTGDSLKPIRSKVRFNDIAGSKEVKEDLYEIIDFLRHPAKYKKFDIRLPKGVLLAGPPGVGKTLMAKAVAGEAKVPFFYQSGANIVEIYVGMGPRRVHELFQAAKKAAPAIIFIDEIDAVGRSRGSLRNEEREATLNQLLTEMDGFESDSGVVVLAATNRIEMLDPALLRPGRFDRRIHLSLPDRQDRSEILELYLRSKPHSVDLEELARSTVGFSAAALSTLVNEAALYALRQGKGEITQEDFDAVRETVISGKRKILSFSDMERRIQAVYQSGKALVATWLDVPYERIGIVTTRMREADREIISRSEMRSRIKVLLAGSLAVEMIYNEAYSNGAEDRAEAIAQARRLVRDFGSGERFVAGDEEVEALLGELYREVRLMLEKLEEARSAIEAWLLEHENIEEDEARRILRDLF